MTSPQKPLAVGPLVLGGNVFGWTADAAASHDVLNAFVAAGGRSIDTADAYSAWVPGHVGGESERIIGQWLATLDGGGPVSRDDVVVATKVAKLEGRRGLARENVRRALGESQDRLGIAVVDLYYAHEDDTDQSPEQIAATFGELVEDGAIRAWGLSNVSAPRTRAIVAAARAAGTAAPAYAQDRYSLVERGIETDLLPLQRELGLAQLPYSSLGSGFLSGKYRPGVVVASARAGAAGRYLERPGAGELLGVLDGVASERGVAVAAVALAWLRGRAGVAAPIASARTVEQVGPLVDSFALELSADETDRLDRVSAAFGAAAG